MRRRRRLLLIQPVHHPEDRLQERTSLIPVFFQLRDDRVGLARGVPDHLLPFGIDLLMLRDERLVTGYRRLLAGDRFLLTHDRLFLLTPRRLDAGPRFPERRL